MFHARLSCILLVALVATCRADGVTPGPGPASILLQLPSGLVGVAPEAASTPSGHTLVAWEAHDGAARVVYYLLLDPQGNIISSIFTLPATYAGRFRVSAGKTRFMLAWEEWSAPGSGLRDVHFRIVDAFGSIIGAGQANEAALSSMWDEVGVDCQGNIHDTFVVSWVRHSPVPGVPTLGVFLRRVAANGALPEPVPTRVDVQSSNFGLQHSTACTIWPSGRILVVWVDGAPGVPSGGPDGDGTGLTARWFNADTTPATGAGLPAGNLLGDQTGPRLSANHRTEAVLAFMSSTGGFPDVCVNRLTDSGQVYDLTPLNLTTGVAGNHILGGIGMAPNGDHVVSWLDAPPVPGGVGGRAAYARLSSPWAFSTGGLVQQGFMEPATGSSETQGLPALTVDQFGNFTGIWPREDAGQWDLRRQVFKRNMITFSNPVPPIGSFVSLFLDSPSDPGHSYLLVMSLGFGPIYIDTREIHLSFDAVALFGLGGAPNGVWNFAGSLDANGFTSSPYLQIPNAPFISGLPINFAFVALDPWGLSPSGINTISDTATLVIQ